MPCADGRRVAFDVGEVHHTSVLQINRDIVLERSLLLPTRVKLSDFELTERFWCFPRFWLQADDGVNVHEVPFDGDVGAAVAAVAGTPNRMYTPASDSVTAAVTDAVPANGP